jgi:hypothetical protein
VGLLVDKIGKRPFFLMAAYTIMGLGFCSWYLLPNCPADENCIGYAVIPMIF